MPSTEYEKEGQGGPIYSLEGQVRPREQMGEEEAGRWQLCSLGRNLELLPSCSYASHFWPISCGHLWSPKHRAIGYITFSSFQPGSQGQVCAGFTFSEPTSHVAIVYGQQ